MICLYNDYIFTLKSLLKVKMSLGFFMFADDSNKSIVYTRWGKKACPTHAELILSGDLMISTVTTLDNEHFKDSCF